MRIGTRSMIGMKRLRWSAKIIAFGAIGSWKSRSLLAVGLLLFFSRFVFAAQALRVVAYNIAEDVDGSTGVPGSDMTTVLQAIGNAHLAGNAQPIDVLALEELYGTPATTLQPIVAALN